MFPRAPRETKGGGSPTRRGQPQESPAAAAAAQIAKKNKNGSYGLHAFVHVCNLDVLQFTSSRQATPHILQEEPASSHSRSYKARVTKQRALLALCTKQSGYANTIAGSGGGV